MQSVDLLKENPYADRGGDPPRSRGQPLPLHRLPQHRQGGAVRRRARRLREQQGALGMTATQDAPARRDRPRPAPQGGPAADHRPHALDRQHHAAGDAAPRDGPQPLRARQHHEHRRQPPPRRCPTWSTSSPARTSARSSGVCINAWPITPDQVTPVHSPMPSDRVAFAGEIVAVVVARTAAEARDAAELVDVEYEELPAVARPQGGRRGRRSRWRTPTSAPTSRPCGSSTPLRPAPAATSTRRSPRRAPTAS